MTEWSSIWSVIIQVINKIGPWHSGSPNCFVTSMITDQTGQHNVLLPINHNYDKICDSLGYFKLKTPEIPSSEKIHLNANLQCSVWCILSNYSHDVYCTISLSCLSAEIRTVERQSDLRIFL